MVILIRCLRGLFYLVSVCAVLVQLRLCGVVFGAIWGAGTKILYLMIHFIYRNI